MSRQSLVPLLFAAVGLVAGYLWIQHGTVIAYDLGLAGGWGNLCF